MNFNSLLIFIVNYLDYIPLKAIFAICKLTTLNMLHLNK